MMRPNNISSFESNKLLIHIGAILTVVAWGSSFVMTKVCLENGLGPAESYAYRTIIAYLLMLLISHSRLMARNLKDELMFVAVGMLAGSIYFITENTALKYTLASNVSLITTTSPLITALLIGIIYRSERPKRSTLIGSLIALSGVGMVIFNSSTQVTIKPLGDLLALGAALSWAIYAIVLRRLNATYDVMFITRKTFFYGLITTIPFMMLNGDVLQLQALSITKVWVNIVALGVMCSVLAFVLWGYAVKKLGAVTASNYLYFQPVATLVLSALILGERVSFMGYSGCAMILIGVFLSDYLGRPRRLNRKRL